MKQDVLLEIGTEEIPARFISPALDQLREKAVDLLKEARIDCARLEVYGTPRRLVLYISEAAERQRDLEQKARGPAMRVAFDEVGKPTKAALGFARSKGVKVEDLIVEDTPQGEYIFAPVVEKGERTEIILSSLFPQMIRSLSFPKSMRWEDKGLRFARPIRWIVALYGEAIIPFTIGDVSSGNITSGHRFIGAGAITITKPSEYQDKLKEGHVVIEPDERRRMIEEEANRLAKEQGGRPLLTNGLLEEVTNLVEYPQVICGSFNPDYLKLPPEVLITSMRSHQRYIPIVKDKEELELVPAFIAVSNSDPEYDDIVREGNERVLNARLADAEFFYREDLKTPINIGGVEKGTFASNRTQGKKVPFQGRISSSLASKVDSLKGVVFQERVGTIYEKTQRVRELASYLSDKLGCDKAKAERAAYLCKADLVTEMVLEFPELQGVVGRIYASATGEEEDVAQAIGEHYYPRFAGDMLPQTEIGSVVSLADKFDTIGSCFSVDLIPTGSQDPYGLRRQAQGIVNIILACDYSLSLKEMIAKALSLVERDVKKELREGVEEEIFTFLLDRLANILAEEGLRYDLAQAVLSSPDDDLSRIYKRAAILIHLSESEGFGDILTGAKRIFNITRDFKENIVPKVELLRERGEKELFELYGDWAFRMNDSLEKTLKFLGIRKGIGERKHLEEIVSGMDEGAQSSLKKLKEALSEIKPAIDNFFDEVMVMVEDEDLRRNRLALLKQIGKSYLKLADLSKIVED